MKLLYIGESWQGSNARSLREALSALPGVAIHEVGEDHFLPKYRGVILRLANRLVGELQLREMATEIRGTLAALKPDAVVVYKGAAVSAGVVDHIRSVRIPVINVFPDFSPHAYGSRLEAAMGRYDLVISAKPFHPPLWQRVYGYENTCIHVPHGFDPEIHLWDELAPADRYDIALCATWRSEYHALMMDLASEFGHAPVSVAIGGHGWIRRRKDFPKRWQLVGPATGRAYGEFLRAARIVIAPVNRQVVIRGLQQPGDEDTARTYELAAAHCFFLHQRTDYVQTVYDEASEVPMWSDARELAALVRRWLPDNEGRNSMASHAHARAVPAYSISARAKLILAHIEGLVHRRIPYG